MQIYTLLFFAVFLYANNAILYKTRHRVVSSFPGLIHAHFGNILDNLCSNRKLGNYILSTSIFIF